MLYSPCEALFSTVVPEQLFLQPVIYDREPVLDELRRFIASCMMAFAYSYQLPGEELPNPSFDVLPHHIGIRTIVFDCFRELLSVSSSLFITF